MLRWVLDLSKVRKARKAACAVISPMVTKSRHRLGTIPDAAWTTPYLTGFMVMLITIVAKMEIGKIEGQALCLVQARSWEEITGVKSYLIGEDILLLNAAHDLDFECGCHNAAKFASFLIENSILDWPHRQFDFGIGAAIPWPERDDLSSLWEQMFDAHINEQMCETRTGIDRISIASL